VRILNSQSSIVAFWSVRNRPWFALNSTTRRLPLFPDPEIASATPMLSGSDNLF